MIKKKLLDSHKKDHFILWEGQYHIPKQLHRDYVLAHNDKCPFCTNVQGYGYLACISCEIEQSQCFLIFLYGVNRKRDDCTFGYPHFVFCQNCYSSVKKIMINEMARSITLERCSTDKIILTSVLTKWLYDNWEYIVKL
jgi:hypothetical protein